MDEGIPSKEEKETAIKKSRLKSKKIHPAINQRSSAVQLSIPLLKNVGAIREVFLALSVRAGAAVLQEMMEQDRTQHCGAPWSRDPRREGVRTGSTPAEVALDGRRVPIRRPRAEYRSGKEWTLSSYAWAAQRDVLDEETWDSVVAGVPTRSYAQSLENLPEDVDERATSKSSVARRFIALGQKRLLKCLGLSLEGIDLRGDACEADWDRDGELDESDCAANNPEGGHPAEVKEVQFDNPSKITIVWALAEFASYYDVSRGDFDSLRHGDCGACVSGLDNDQADTDLTDTEEPAPGTGYEYLVRTVNEVCDLASTWGAASSGDVRVDPLADPCP